MKDIMVNANNELFFEDGDFVVDESDIQNQNHLVVASKGEYKTSPEIGANVLDMLSEDNPKKGITEIKKQLEYDGAKVENITYKNNVLEVKAKYNQ